MNRIKIVLSVFLGVLPVLGYCQIGDTIAIRKTLDDWHQAAATADEETYFGLMSGESIFMGTDASERWSLEQFQEFAMPHFQKESAWAFTAKDRYIYFTEDGKTAWFDELLDTWMGDCRGSGVLQLKEGGWKIMHYNLAILVPNDLVKGYLELLKEKKP